MERTERIAVANLEFYGRWIVVEMNDELVFVPKREKTSGALAMEPPMQGPICLSSVGKRSSETIDEPRRVSN